MKREGAIVTCEDCKQKKPRIDTYCVWNYFQEDNEPHRVCGDCYRKKYEVTP